MTRKKLIDLTMRITDGEHGIVIDDPSGKYYLLSNKNIQSGRIAITDNDRKISLETFSKIKKRTQLSKDDVVIATVGTIGKSAIIREEKINFDFQRSVGIIRCDPNKLLPLYLYYYLNLPYVQKQLTNRVNGGVQKCLYIGDLENLEIDYIDISQQKKIVSILSAIDTKIDLNNRINSELESMGKMVFNYWFSKSLEK